MSEGDLATQIRDILTRRAADDPCITYRELAEQLGLQPPGTIQRVAVALEQTMREDVAAGRAMIAALVVSRTGEMPRPGFFELAVALGRFPDDPAQHRAAWQAECAVVLRRQADRGA
jgi:hypothetical protein